MDRKETWKKILVQPSSQVRLIGIVVFLSALSFGVKLYMENVAIPRTTQTLLITLLLAYVLYQIFEELAQVLEKKEAEKNEELSENAENIWKVLSHFPNGTVAKEVQKITGLRKTAVYAAFKELESKDLIEKKGKVRVIKAQIPITEKSSRLGFFEWLEKNGSTEKV